MTLLYFLVPGKATSVAGLSLVFERAEKSSLFVAETLLNMLKALPIMAVGSLILAGSSRVVDCLPMCAKASTHFSAIKREVAVGPCFLRASEMAAMLSAVALAFKVMAWASPDALLTFSALSASEARMVDCLFPSAYIYEGHKIFVNFESYLVDGCLTETFGFQDLSSLLPLCRDLTVHTLDNLFWRLDVPNFVSLEIKTPKK